MSPRNPPGKGRQHKATITEIKIEGKNVAQDWMATVSQWKAERAQSRANDKQLDKRIRIALRKMQEIVDNGGTVEPGEFKLVRGPGGKVDVY